VGLLSNDEGQEIFNSSELQHCSFSTIQSSVPHIELKRRRPVDDPLFVASPDRTKTTPREAVHIVASALKAADVDIDTMPL